MLIITIIRSNYSTQNLAFLCVTCYPKYLTYIISLNRTLQGVNNQYPHFIDEEGKLRDIKKLPSDADIERRLVHSAGRRGWDEPKE